MQNALVGLAVLACPVGMGLMMWFMSKGMRKERPPVVEESRPIDAQALRAEHRRLGEQIDRLEREGAPEARLREAG